MFDFCIKREYNEDMKIDEIKSKIGPISEIELYLSKVSL